MGGMVIGITEPVLPPAVRHETIFGVFAAVPLHHTVLLVNDHDPKPLLYQLDAEQPGTFTYEYLERGPGRYAIQLTRVKP